MGNHPATLGLPITELHNVERHLSPVSASSARARLSGTRPEDALLLSCARTRMDAETAERLRELLRGQLDWVHLLVAAHQHGLRPLLYWQLHATCPKLVPAPWMDDLRDYFHRLAQRNLFLASELHKIIEKLAADGVIAIPVKGPTLAAKVYGNLALREFADLDFLVRDADVSNARASLALLGYCLQGHRNHAGATTRPRAAGQYAFARDDRTVSVELHSEITLRHFPVALDLPRLWERSQPVSLGGKTVRTLSPEDLLLFLCVHGAKDFWQQLKWICDIAELALSPEELDWDQVLDRAHELRCEPMLFLGLNLASELLGAPLPEQVARRVRADAAASSSATWVRQQLFQDDGVSPGIGERLLFRLRMGRGLWDSLRYSLRLAMSPTEEDYALLRLPALLDPLYALLRPVRLAREYGVGLLRRSLRKDLGGFEPTPMEFVGPMLALAEVRPADVVYDLGCGDGRLVIEAARRFGSRGVGIDIDPRRIAQAKANARKQGVGHLVKFIQQDAKTVDVSEATVVLLYLPWVGNIKLRERLRQQLPRSARVVSRDGDMGSWPPDKVEHIEDGARRRAVLYLWRIEK